MNAEIGRIVAAQELFRSAELLVRRVGGFGSDVCYVTFDSYTDHRTLDRPGFGEEYLRGRAIDAIHVLSRDNHWYQYPEWLDALAAIAAVTGGYRRVIAYGSSMGGFAALRYGAACGASVGVALSPQFTVDPAIVPFDTRWAGDVARIRFRDDACTPLATQYIAYDPCDAEDRQHFELFAACSAVQPIPVPHGGHPVGSYLVETGLLGPLLQRIEAGPLNVAAFTREIRGQRRQSGHYFFVLSQRTPPHRARQKLALAQLAVARHADNPVYHTQLAAALDAAGDRAAARRTFRHAIGMRGSGFYQSHALLLHLEQHGRINAALAVGRRLLRHHPDILWLPKTIERLRRKRRHQTLLGRLAHHLYLDRLLDRLQA